MLDYWGVVVLVVALVAFIVGWVRADARGRTVLLAVFTGALGIVSGYLLYVYVSHEAQKSDEALGGVLGLLLIVGVMSFVFEVVRHTIEGHDEPWPVPRILSTIVMLAVFELYVVAWHEALSEAKHLSEISESIFGEHLAGQLGPNWNLVVLGALWVAVGVSVALTLRRYIVKVSAEPVADPTARWPSPRDIWRGARAGFVGGMFWAPVMAIGYVVLVRAWLFTEWIRNEPAAWQDAQWVPHLTGWLAPLSTLLSAPLAIVKWLADHGHVVGVLLGLAVIIVLGADAMSSTSKGERLWGIPLLVIGVVGAVSLIPIVSSFFFAGDSLTSLIQLCVLAMFIWGVPAVLLGALAPCLRKPAKVPELWGVIAFGAAVVLAASFRWGALPPPTGHIVLGLAVFFVLSGVALLRRLWVVEVWPVVGLSVAILVWAGTSFAHKLDVFELQRVAYRLVTVSLSGGTDRPAPVSTTWGDWPAPLPSLIKNSAEPGSLDAMLGREPCRRLLYELDLYITQVRDDGGKARRAQAGLRDNLVSLKGRVTAATAVPPPKDPKDDKDGKDGKKKLSKYGLKRERMAALEKEGRHAAALVRGVDRIRMELRRGAAEHPRRPEGDPCESVAGPRHLALHRELAQRALTYDRIWVELATLRTDVLEVEKGIGTALEPDRIQMARLLELAVTASFGFWATVGMLAMWSLLDPADKDGHDVDRRKASRVDLSS